MAATSAAGFRDLFFGAFDTGAVNFGAVDLGRLSAVLRRPLPGFVLWFDSIHADMVAELTLASSGMTMPLSWAIFSANNICAGLAVLGPSSQVVSPTAFLGACWPRNVRQIDTDFV